MKLSSLSAALAFLAAFGIARAGDRVADRVADHVAEQAADRATDQTGDGHSDSHIDAVPPEQQWHAAIATFAEVLGGKADKDALDKVLSDHSWVAPFARNRTESVAVLPDRVDGQRVVSVHSCLHPSVTSATDLVADLQADTSIDESIRRKLIPPAGYDLRQADATMARWFTIALEAQPGDPVALIAMYHAGEPAGPGVQGVAPSLTLILVRGEFAPNDGPPRVSRVLYGSLEAAVR